MKHLGYVLGIVFLLVAFVMSCAPTPKPAQEPIRIGFHADFTGLLSVLGPAQQRAADMVIADVGGEVAGRKLEIVLEDSAGDPTISADKARKMLEYDNVVAMVAPVMGHAAAAVAAWSKPYQIPVVAPYGTYDLLEGGNVFLPFGTTAGYTYDMGLYVAKDLGFKTATALIVDYAYGHDALRGFTAGLQEGGGKVIQVQLEPFGEMDYAPYLTALEPADYFFHQINCATFPAFIKQYREFGIEMPVGIANTGAAPEVLLNELGDITLGIYCEGPYSSFSPNTPENKQVVDWYKAKYGVYPEEDLAVAYVPLMIIVKAIEATGGDTTPEALNKAMRKIEVTTFQGAVSFDESGLGIFTSYIQQVQKIGDRYSWVEVKTIPDIYRPL